MNNINNSLDQSLKSITKGAAIVFFGLFISKLLAYAYRILAARHPSIGVEGYGLLSLGLAVFSMLSLISLLGLNQGVLRYVPYYRAKKDEKKVKGTIVSALKITTPFAIILAILLFIFSEWIAVNLFSNPRLEIVLKIIAFAIPLDSIRNIVLFAFRGFKKIGYEIYSKNIADNLLKLVLAVLFIYLGWGLFGITLAYLLGVLFSTLIAFYLLEKKVFPILFSKLKAVKITKTLLAYSWPLLFTAMLLFLIAWTDTFMIGYLTKNASLVGIYNAAMPTAQLLWMFPLALLVLFIPILTEFYAMKKKEEFASVYKTVTKWIFFVNTFLVFSFIIFSRKILNIIFGSEYVLGSSALMILSTGLFINIGVRSSEHILMILKRTKLVFLNSFIAALLNIILNWYLIPIYGITGAAIATASALILMAILMVSQSYAITKINPFKWNYIKIFLSALISFTIGIILIKTVFHIENIYFIIPVLFILFFIYFLFLLLTKSFEREDIMILKTIQQKTGFGFRILNKIIKKFL